MFVQSKMPSSVIGVRHSGYEKFINEDPHKVKIIMVSTKPITPPMFKSLSISFRKEANFAVVSQSETQLVAKLGVTSFPAIVMVSSLLAEPKIYTGDMTFTKVSSWISKNYKDALKHSGVTSLKMDKSSSIQLCPADSYCAILCISTSTQKRAEQLIKDAKGRYPNLHFSWLDSHKQSAFVEALGVPTQKDSLIVLSRKRNKFIWTENLDSLTEFLAGVLTGDKSFQKVDNFDTTFALLQ
jgi:hypothetical protein